MMAEAYSLEDLDNPDAVEKQEEYREASRRRTLLSPLTVAVVAEGTFQQAVQRHERDVLKGLHAGAALGRQAAPLVLRDRNKRRSLSAWCGGAAAMAEPALLRVLRAWCLSTR